MRTEYKKVEVVKQEIKAVYVAVDGKEFESLSDCIDYEEGFRNKVKHMSSLESWAPFNGEENMEYHLIML